jgi:Ig-like domain CHU_C associated
MRIASLLTLCAVLAAPTVFAATFVVPDDRAMVRRTDAIVVATAISSHTRLRDSGAIETVTLMSLEESIKGMKAEPGDSFEVHEPGGVYGDRATFIPGVPRFIDGERVLLFLSRTPRDTWAVTDIALGKFSFAHDRAGRHLAVRNEGEINGWGPDLEPHVEGRRDAEKFLEFLRAEGRGQMGKKDYFVPRDPIERYTIAPNATDADVVVNQNHTPRSYTMDIGGGNAARWNVFPSPVSFYTGTATISGAPNGGVTAAQQALAAWTNDCGSNVNYVYAGGSASHTNGLDGTDGANTILFERDLTDEGVGRFNCSSNSYGGTLGLGGITSATSVPHTFAGETNWFTTREVDVEMNQGISGCTFFLSRGDLNSAIAHEVGHTLSFRHADRTRPVSSQTSCTVDPSLECASSAIMTAFVTHGLNATLQQWDVNAVRALYPGGSCSGCTAPTITSQPLSQTAASGAATTLTVAASGTNLRYQWYAGNSGFTGAPLSGGTGTSIVVTPTVTSSYWVQVSNDCGTVNSSTAVITVNSCSPPTIAAHPQSQTIAQGQTATLSVSAGGTGLRYQWYAGNSGFELAPLSGQTGSSVNVAPTVTSSYWVKVTNACGASVNSNTAVVTVGCAAPVITSQPPASTTIMRGGTVTLSVQASGSGLSYQWYAGNSGYTLAPLSGQTGPSLTVSPTVTSSYWVRVSNACGAVNSQTAVVNVGCSLPSITSQPASRTITRGQSTTLTVGATGSGLTYQWYAGNSGYTLAPLSGQTGSSLTVAPTVTSSYWVRVSNACGSVDSATAVVTVGCTAPAITSQPTSRTIARGQSTTITVGASGAGLTYQWYAGNSGYTLAPLSGQTGPSLTVAPTVTSSYWVRVSNACGSVNSNTAVVTVTQ